MPEEDPARVGVVLLDDETVSRAGLSSILGADSSIALIAAVGTQEEAVQLAGQHIAEVIVASVEYWRRGLDIDALSDLVSTVQVPVMLVGANLNPQTVRSARAAGAAGLISKRASTHAIRGAVHAAWRRSATPAATS